MKAPRPDLLDDLPVAARSAAWKRCVSRILPAAPWAAEDAARDAAAEPTESRAARAALRDAVARAVAASDACAAVRHRVPEGSVRLVDAGALRSRQRAKFDVPYARKSTLYGNRQTMRQRASLPPQGDYAVLVARYTLVRDADRRRRALKQREDAILRLAQRCGGLRLKIIVGAWRGAVALAKQLRAVFRSIIARAAADRLRALCARAATERKARRILARVFRGAALRVLAAWRSFSGGRRLQRLVLHAWHDTLGAARASACRVLRFLAAEGLQRRFEGWRRVARRGAKVRRFLKRHFCDSTRLHFDAWRAVRAKAALAQCSWDQVVGRSKRAHFNAWRHLARVQKVAGKFRVLLGGRQLQQVFNAWRSQAKRDHVQRLKQLRVAHKGGLLGQFYLPQGPALPEAPRTTVGSPAAARTTVCLPAVANPS
ncbi:hypothetical protein M885DRAFT_525570 [Pelagophyceae sp. CCMP2097]|nr:hypothetical protein M885DRAFT_525570 [Pelagophyceae sp. CCMP2097]